MALDPVVNFFESEIATLPVASGGTVIVLSSGDGNKLPNPSVDGAFNLTIYEEGNPFSSPEIVRVTARTSDTLTVTRAQEGTTATTKTTGTTWKVVMFPTAKTIQDIDSAKLDKAGGTMTGTLTATKLIPSGNVTAGNGMYLPTTNTLAFSTNGVERVRVNADGNMGIGTNDPARRLTIAGQGAFSATTGASIRLNNTTTGRLAIIDFDNDNFLNLWANAATSGHRFFTGDGAGTERLRITSAGNVGIGTTSPATKLDVSGSIRASTGILFGTDTASANTLDDYEEGTWTVQLSAETPFTSITYDSVRSGRYTKIGNIVICYFTIRTASISGGAGGVSISNLPFTVISQAAFNGGGGSLSQAGNVGAFAGDVPSGITAGVNTTSATLNYRATSNGNSVILDVSDLDTGSAKNWMYGMIIYATSQ